uniref:(northern house mosquito) hypothetical protein n=1 Tax=Culex pipiens TaxID=7175 RepID=A0A8D8E1K7_CULPI
MGLVRGGTRNSGTVSSSLRSGWPPRMDGVRASVLSDLECTRGGTIFGREIDTLAAGGDASNREKRRNIVLDFIFQMLLFSNISHTSHGSDKSRCNWWMLWVSACFITSNRCLHPRTDLHRSSFGSKTKNTTHNSP